MDKQGPVIFLFQNTKKKGDRDPDLTGTWKDEPNPECWASAWWNKSKDGDAYLRIIKGREKEPRDGEHPAQSAPAGSSRPMSHQHRPNKSYTDKPVPTANQVASALTALGKDIPEPIGQAILQGQGDEPWFDDIPF